LTNYNISYKLNNHTFDHKKKGEKMRTLNFLRFFKKRKYFEFEGMERQEIIEVLIKFLNKSATIKTTIPELPSVTGKIITIFPDGSFNIKAKGLTSFRLKPGQLMNIRSV